MLKQIGFYFFGSMLLLQSCGNSLYDYTLKLKVIDNKFSGNFVIYKSIRTSINLYVGDTLGLICYPPESGGRCTLTFDCCSSQIDKNSLKYEYYNAKIMELNKVLIAY